MSSFKKLIKSDISVVPYEANKQWTIASSSFDSYLKIYEGTNIIGTFNPSTDPTTTDGQYKRLIYNQVNHLYYQTYTGSLNTSSLANSIYYESASQQRPTASYFIFNDKSELIKNFPTGANETIQVISVNQNVYGNKILPYTFVISSSVDFIVDDGFGNLLVLEGSAESYINNGYFDAVGYFADNIVSAGSYIGNIFYAQGIAIITDQSSQNVIAAGSQILFKNEYTIYEHEIRCLVKESDYNLSYNQTLLVSGGLYIVSSSNGYILTGSNDSSVKDFATGSLLTPIPGSISGSTSGYFTPYATTLGLYNDNNELLAVAKFGKPMLMSPDTDMTFVIKYDT
jgi:hypothetical protein